MKRATMVFQAGLDFWYVKMTSIVLILMTIFISITSSAWAGLEQWISNESAGKVIADIAIDSSSQRREFIYGEQGKNISRLSNIYIPFISNRGQVEGTCKFYAKIFGGTVFITENERLVYSLDHNKNKYLSMSSENITKENPLNETITSAISERMVNGKISSIRGEKESITRVSYFTGNDKARWTSGIKAYDIVSLGEIYDGIELKLKAYSNTIEKLFHIKPYADPRNIRIRVEGAKALNVNENGELEVQTELGIVMKFSKPVAYQGDKERKYIETAYIINGNEYGFKVQDYDRTRELVIDPILASTYVDGNEYLEVNSIATDSSGNVYITGLSHKYLVPTYSFVAKFDRNLNDLLTFVYLKGNEAFDVVANAIAIDSVGNVFVAGATRSPTFPTSPDAYQYYISGAHDAFISKFDSDLIHLLSSTYLGGKKGDEIQAMTVDSSDNVYVTGGTSSDNFPMMPGAYNSNYIGGADFYGSIFVAKLNNQLTHLLASTYLGGWGAEAASGIVIDSVGNVFVTGETTSENFPTTPGSYKSNNDLGSNTFLSKFDSQLTTLLASTRLWAGSIGKSNSIVIDPKGDVYVSGGKPPGSSVNWILSIDAYYGSGGMVSRGYDALVAKLDNNLSRILAYVEIGGSLRQYASSMGLNPEGNVYIAGYTESRDFPVKTGSCFGEDAFVSMFDATLTKLLASTCIGGSEKDSAKALALDYNGDIVIAGLTESSDFPTTPSSYQSTYDISPNSFVAKIDPNLYMGPAVPNIMVRHRGNKLAVIYNRGAANLIISAITSVKQSFILNVNGGPKPCGSFNPIIAPDDSCTFTVTYKGSCDFKVQNSVIISSNDPVTPSTVILYGSIPCPVPDDPKVIKPIINVSPMSVKFGTAKVGSTSNPKTVKIKNTGNEYLIVHSINMTGANASEFNQTNDCGILPANSSCQITLTFSPTLPFGKKSATMSISTNDTKKPTVNVKLSGQAPPPKISSSPSFVNFGSISVGNTPTPKTVSIKNTGISDLVISSIDITGTNATEFSKMSDCTAIAKGSSCSINITFTPLSAGSKSATLNISTNDPKKLIYAVKLLGKGI